MNKTNTTSSGTPKLSVRKRLCWALRYWRARWGWRLADWFITHSPQRFEPMNQATKIELWVLMDDGIPASRGGVMEQMTYELTSEQWARLEAMKGLTLCLEVTDKTGNQRNLEAHFYDRQDSPEAVRHHIFYSQLSGDRSGRPDQAPNSIGTLLRRLLSGKDRIVNDLGS